ncbi:MAG: DUF3473 domain-containing protein [Desulfobacterales bacterium]|nr:DUF3473 domain-containing protein [Desulfobacterales bacterium]
MRKPQILYKECRSRAFPCAKLPTPQHSKGVHEPNLIYFHPREFSRKRSVAGPPPAKRFVLHAGIWGSEARLLRLLTHFHFTTVGQYLKRPTPL